MGYRRDRDAFTRFLREHPNYDLSISELSAQMTRARENHMTNAEQSIQEQSNGGKNLDRCPNSTLMSIIAVELADNRSSLLVAPGSTSHRNPDQTDSQPQVNGHHTTHEEHGACSHIGGWCREDEHVATNGGNNPESTEALGAGRQEGRNDNN